MEKYFTKDKYLEIKGIDLAQELQDDDDASKKCERFIHRITDWCQRYLVRHYGATQLEEWDKLTEDQQNCFVLGCIEQAEYALTNGFVMLNSGYNQATGMTIDFQKMAMSKDALEIFWDGCFANIQGVKHTRDSNFGGWY